MSELSWISQNFSDRRARAAHSMGEPGLFLVSDRTPAREWESFPRGERKLVRERLGPVSGNTRAKKRPPTDGQELGKDSDRQHLLFAQNLDRIQDK